MPLASRRVFRLSLTMALSLVCGYALALPLPFLPAVFALLLTASPAPPMGMRSILGLVFVMLITLGVGLLLIPLLHHYPLSAVLIVAGGIYFSNYMTVNLGKNLVGTLLSVGFTMIPAAGTVSFALALGVIQTLVLGIALAVTCQRLVYPWFPENSGEMRAVRSEPRTAVSSNWLALRATFIILPAFVLVLVNPAMYLPIIMKTVLLSQQASSVSARQAGRELLGSTFLGGCFAVMFWFALDLLPTLWMFFWWMFLFCTFFASRLYRRVSGRLSASFWQNTISTMLILLGPAVEDSANGKDVYMAFAVRMALFVGVTLYAWISIVVLDQLRARSRHRTLVSMPEAEAI